MHGYNMYFGKGDVPELTTYNFDNFPPVDSVKNVASSSATSVPKNAEWQYESCWIWLTTALVTVSWPWPRHETAAPPVESRNLVPSSRKM